MSFYRPPKAVTALDVTAPVSPKAADASIPPESRETESVWAPLRKTNPLNVVLPLSREWLDSLPPDVRPTALAEQFPRIVNVIAVAWNDLPATRKLLDDLVIDRRGTRSGFPLRVRQELKALRDYAYTRI